MSYEDNIEVWKAAYRGPKAGWFKRGVLDKYTNRYSNVTGKPDIFQNVTFGRKDNPLYTTKKQHRWYSSQDDVDDSRVSYRRVTNTAGGLTRTGKRTIAGGAAAGVLATGGGIAYSRQGRRGKN